MIFLVVTYDCETWTIKKAECWRIDVFKLECWRRLSRVPWTARRSNQSILNIHWKGWCWFWSFKTLTTLCEVPTHWKRPWCWERLKARREGDDRRWDGWMTSPTQWTWVWAKSGLVKNREDWHAVGDGVAKSPTQLSDWITEFRILKISVTVWT